MTNAIAYTILGLVIGILVLDHEVLHLGIGLEVARKGTDLIRWLAFWR